MPETESPMTRIWLDPAFTRKRWKTQQRFTALNMALTTAITICALAYLTSVDNITTTIATWPVMAIGMSLCTTIASWSHCITLKGFVDMTTHTPQENTHAA